MTHYLCSVPYIQFPLHLSGKLPNLSDSSQNSYLCQEFRLSSSVKLLAFQLFTKPIRRGFRQTRKDRDAISTQCDQMSYNKAFSMEDFFFLSESVRENSFEGQEAFFGHLSWSRKWARKYPDTWEHVKYPPTMHHTYVHTGAQLIRLCYATWS